GALPVSDSVWMAEVPSRGKGELIEHPANLIGVARSLSVHSPVQVWRVNFGSRPKLAGEGVPDEDRLDRDGGGICLLDAVSREGRRRANARGDEDGALDRANAGVDGGDAAQGSFLHGALFP